MHWLTNLWQFFRGSFSSIYIFLSFSFLNFQKSNFYILNFTFSCSFITIKFTHCPHYTVFGLSGFGRTVCGSFATLANQGYVIGNSNGRTGCCPSGSFMSSPLYNPFLKDKQMEIFNACVEKTHLVQRPPVEVHANLAHPVKLKPNILVEVL